uniref:EF-hand domain-containing protein n=1 Tax=Globodera rostochiensis TaxID=31243 RepID=A0A914ICH7_GLORO
MDVPSGAALFKPTESAVPRNIGQESLNFHHPKFWLKSPPPRRHILPSSSFLLLRRPLSEFSHRRFKELFLAVDDEVIAAGHNRGNSV